MIQRRDPKLNRYEENEFGDIVQQMNSQWIISNFMVHMAANAGPSTNGSHLDSSQFIQMLELQQFEQGGWPKEVAGRLC